MAWDFRYESAKAIAELLEEQGFSLSKKFGQNFLLSKHAVHTIVDALKVAPNSRLWEIGPGIGALTIELLRQHLQVTAFEIDHGFCRILRERAFKDEPNFLLVEGDFLKTWNDIHVAQGTPAAICGNLPYNVGSICIAKLLEAQCLPAVMVFTLQTEVADRLMAKAGSKQYAPLSILSSIDYSVTKLCSIPSSQFFPPPRVESTVVQFQRLSQPKVEVERRKDFLTLVDDLFTQRRKTVRNNLLVGSMGKLFGKEQILAALDNAEIDHSARAEMLDIPVLLRLLGALNL